MSHKVGATTTARGNVVLAQHLAGTADLPEVQGFTLNDNGDVNNHRLLNVADATGDGDGVNLGQVRALLRAQDYKDSVRVATAAALPAYTRTGNEIVFDANGSFNDAGIDGIDDLALGESFLLRNEHAQDGSDAGIYEITVVGDAGTPAEAVRRADADSDAEVTPGMLVGVEEGTTLAGHYFRLVTANITLNTTDLVFTDFSAPVSFGTPSKLTEGDPAAGSSDNAARADHQHGSKPATDGDDWGDASNRWTVYSKGLNVGQGAIFYPSAVNNAVAQSPYTTQATDAIIEWDTSAGACEHSLPNPVTPGRVLEIILVTAGNDLTIKTHTGSTYMVLSAAGEGVRLRSTGTAWRVMP